MEPNLGKHGATRQSWSRESIRSIIHELQNEHPKANHRRLVELVAERMREDDDALIAAADYAVTAALNAQEDYAARNSPGRVHERQKSKEAVEATVESIKAQILMLNLEMPNGKRMRYCTGEEMGKFGMAYGRIAKKVGKTKLVGSVLNEQQVRDLVRC